MRELVLAVLLSACAGPPAVNAPASVGRTWLDPTLSMRADVSTALVVVERYRVALKHGDTETLLALASDDYLDTSGTPSTDDDVDRDGLASALRRWNAIAITDLDLHVLEVTRHADVLVLRVHHRFRVRIRGRESELVEDHEMALTPRGRSWAFVRGM